MWFAVFGPPAAWATEFWLGYWATQTDCSAPATTQNWHLSLNWWGIGLMVAMFCVAIAAGLTAFALFRGAGDAAVDDAPPRGRVRFLATVGMTVTVLFTFMIVMTGIGIVILPNCHQS